MVPAPLPQSLLVRVASLQDRLQPLGMAQPKKLGQFMIDAWEDITPSEWPQAKEIKAEKVSLEEVLFKSDYISINLPMLPETKGILKKREFSLMKPSAYIVNLARGPIWDEKALYSALKEGKIAGAGSDVYEVEPAAKGHPLFELENFVGSPHMAAHTEEALRRMSLVAEDVICVLEGKVPVHPVNRPRSR